MTWKERLRIELVANTAAIVMLSLWTAFAFTVGMIYERFECSPMPTLERVRVLDTNELLRRP